MADLERIRTRKSWQLLVMYNYCLSVLCTYIYPKYGSIYNTPDHPKKRLK